MLACHTQLLDLLEVPSLMDTCVHPLGFGKNLNQTVVLTTVRFGRRRPWHLCGGMDRNRRVSVFRHHVGPGTCAVGWIEIGACRCSATTSAVVRLTNGAQRPRVNKSIARTRVLIKSIRGFRYPVHH
jgi:hypothetical protein